MYMYVRNRINKENSELNSPRISEGDYFFRFFKIESMIFGIIYLYR